MQIVYYYIEELNDIKQQNINFGDKYIFNYDPITKELTAEENELYIENFYGDNINITAIIGENGTGKTSLLNKIKTQIDTYYPYEKTLFIIKNEDIYHLYSYGYKVVNKTVVNLDEINNIKIDSDLRFFFPISNKSNIIYHSNILEFDDKYNLEYKSKILNISTHFLMFKKSNKYNDIDKFRNNENLKNICFISNNNSINKLINLPNKVEITIRNLSSLFILNNIIDNLDTIQEIFNEDSIDNKLKFKIYILYNSLIYSSFKIIEIINSSDLSINDKRKFIIQVDLIVKEFIKEISSISLNKKSILKKIEIIFTKSLKKLTRRKIIKENLIYENILEFISMMDSLIDISNFNYSSLIEIDIYSNQLYKLVNSSNPIIIDDIFIKFKIRNLSSGERALINLFSRLYDLIQSKNIEKENIIFLIDEIDLYFHPDWQKQLINKLIDFFKIYFKDKKIHLIFTANNPLMISDILSYNTIFLQKIDNNTTIINNSLTDHKNTFAANIHTLLSDSFFMKNGTMGDFAKNKLNGIIEKLNSKKGTISETERENIKKTIKLIGEPIIRKKLMSMYNECFYDDVISRIDRLEELMKKLGDDKN